MVASKAIGDRVTATLPADGPYDPSGTMLAQMLAESDAVPSELPPKVP